MLDLVLKRLYLHNLMISNFPDFYVFWDIPTDQNFVPKNTLNLPELGNFPTSSDTESDVYVYGEKIYVYI